MSFAPRSLRACCSKSVGKARRYASSSSNDKSTRPSANPTVPLISASLLLSRNPLITPTPHPLQTAYHRHSSRIEHALSNPVPTAFYFKPGSLPIRRFQVTNHQTELSYYGERLAGSPPDVGDINMEVDLADVRGRTEWAEKDGERGEKSLERFPEEEVFCLVQNASGKWGFPRTELEKGEGLDQAVRRGLVGSAGSLGGEGMDTWLVTRKPIGTLDEAGAKSFFLRSHILAGQPSPPSSTYKSWSWLTRQEVEERLKSQGDESVWEGVKGMFGVGEEADA